MLKLAVLISGRGSNLKAIIDSIRNGALKAEIKIVISNKSDAGGLQHAREAGIETAVIKHKDFPTREAFEMEMDKLIADRKVDLICLAGFMRIISPWFIGKWKGRIINIHPSLLPAFKGVNAQKQALDAGVKEAGCTVHFVTEEMDSGEIILQAKVPVLEGDTEETLSARILEQEHKIYPDAIAMIRGREDARTRKKRP